MTASPRTAQTPSPALPTLRRSTRLASVHSAPGMAMSGLARGEPANRRGGVALLGEVVRLPISINRFPARTTQVRNFSAPATVVFMAMTYCAVQAAARKRLAGRVCAWCGTTQNVRPSLRPDVDPASLRWDAKRCCWFSANLEAYRPLCERHHRQAIERLRTAPARFAAACERARRCSICNGPMLAAVGPQRAHLSCAQRIAAA